MSTAASRHDLRERFLAVETANVADVLDEMGLPDQGLSADFLPHTGQRLAGWAYTISGQMAPYEGSGDAAKMQACEGVGADEVTVWGGDGSGVCFFGELIALGMAERGCVGAVVDGGIRDVRWLDEHGFPVFARYRTPVQSIGRWRVTGWQEPVYLPGATTSSVVVAPGDFVLADEDGVITVPEHHVEEVLERAETMSATEEQVRAALRDGVPLSECLRRFGHV